MKTVASTLGVARSNLIERRDKVIQARGPYRKAEDAGLLLPIRAIIDERPTYGYRRVWALLNRHLRSAGKPTVNMKRVLRIMQNHGLTLERHTARRPDRAHDGVTSRCTRISDGALIISSCTPGIARSSGSCSCSMPATARSSPGRPWRTPVSPARWYTIS